MVNLSSLAQKLVRVLDATQSSTFLPEELGTDIVKWSDEIKRRYSLYKTRMDFASASNLARREVIEYLIREELDRYLIQMPIEIESAHDSLDNLPVAPPRNVDESNRYTLAGRIDWLDRNALIESRTEDQ